ncbi:MAG: cellobiose phosphorylase [Candidatus Omnitrophica bacterium]|nr:cellobiose phosphorylase [Candidatus Omnitrophota bacterium]
MNNFFKFLPDGVSFESTEAAKSRLVYGPLCGVDDDGIKSAITPFLSGDIKVDKARYLTKPASREDLRSPVRNFFVKVEGRGIGSMADDPDGNIKVEMGLLWHKVTRAFPALGLEVEALNFVPVSGEKLELMKISVKNISAAPVMFIPTGVVPVFGRALSNKHDHEHVTALLNRVEQIPSGILVTPTMRFNEEGHRANNAVYYVLGIEADGRAPQGSFPTVESFLGEEGTWLRPFKVVLDDAPRQLNASERNGKEAVGAIRFLKAVLNPGEVKEYIIAVGICDNRASILKDFVSFNTHDKFQKAFEENQAFWSQKTSSILFDNGDANFSSWMRWVVLQPVLRRIFGCSFLPDHDYGKGGKGWRDIWQDLLSLILIEPETVRGQLLNNFAGVRIDGTNATIIGQKPGEFLADRNAITRVWMDHGVWPWVTTLLYIDQTGDVDFLFEELPFFSDPQMSRTLQKDEDWTPASGHELKDKQGQVYQGTVLEHLLIQNLVQFFNVGEHNIIRLESADWNDGLDMAFKRGESVAFMAFYGGNLLAMADLLEKIAKRDGGARQVKIAKELLFLTDTLSAPVNYNSVEEKQKRLFDEYCSLVQPALSGVRIDVDAHALAEDLRKKGTWIKSKIRAQESISCEDAGEKFSWFNGYYDNNGERVEGKKEGNVRMTLTGQVFPIMHGVATPQDTAEVVKSVRNFLKDKNLGGFRLNTDFGVPHYLAMGRAFGFAFGTKENGAVFSHMAVMYAYALYKQGFAREGHEVLHSLYEMGTHPSRAKIYPGLPEYFDIDGRGMYHFLTGSASWYILTLLTMVYGVRGDLGDLVLSPKLMREEFSSLGEARVACFFAGRHITVTYANPSKLDAGAYRIEKVLANGAEIAVDRKNPCEVVLKRAFLSGTKGDMDIRVTLA